MRKIWVPVILSLVVAVIVSAQSLVESAAAAAGGSAAGVAGKKVSDGLDKVFSSVGGVAATAAGTGDAKGRRGMLSVPPIPEVRMKSQPAGATPGPLPRTGGGRQANLRGPAQGATAAVTATDPAPVAEAVPAAPAAPPAPLATVEDLKTLSGATREDVVGKMGKPAARITSNDDGGLVEVYTFRGQGGSLGSVRMMNGKVTDVRPAQQ